ncbi:WcaA Glycosyltransferases involved in cell wall biogenesis [Candidatus Methylopumilus planktonicus]|uniref:glycosyltransferase family 2 protein n=1 Tax=Candidatus Methylopumilus planktonicus TaxID=1581557 RepID=UPI003BEF15C2
MKQPLVSIVIPTFNRVAFIEASIDSILFQSYKKIQLIVVDDGSTDDTINLLQQKYGSRIELIRNRVNSGQVKSLNLGWSKCKGKYLGYLSSDDILNKEALAFLVEILESQSEVICAYPNNDLINHLGESIKSNICSEFSYRKSLLSLECPIGVGALFRKSVFKKLNGWNPTYKIMPDLDFWLNVSELGKIHFLDKSLGSYRFHIDSGIYKKFSYLEVYELVNIVNKQFNENKLAQHFFDQKNTALSSAYAYAARILLRSYNFKAAFLMFKKARESDINNFGIIKFVKILRYAYSPLLRRLL